MIGLCGRPMSGRLPVAQPTCHCSFCSINKASMGRSVDASSEKIPMTSVLRLSEPSDEGKDFPAEVTERNLGDQLQQE